MEKSLCLVRKRSFTADTGPWEVLSWVEQSQKERQRQISQKKENDGRRGDGEETTQFILIRGKNPLFRGNGFTTPIGHKKGGEGHCVRNGTSDPAKESAPSSTAPNVTSFEKKREKMRSRI